ncbi:DUF1381 domain-containing protein [Staphylococcus sp. GDY8P57P]|uniref:DUF1381 domain-containing protein n=1 Tax=Staphylococcus sp. GDY8P57P TaxID=2804128 RepID=UPI001AEC57DA|nr:DUF1381 domain-containing protein [Staphylococcus sp. GDY8P57P]
MKQYLIREFTDSTGYVHVNVEEPRENEKIYIVEANSKEQAQLRHTANKIKERFRVLGNVMKNLSRKLGDRND